MDVLHTLREIRVGHLLEHVRVLAHDDADGVFRGRLLRRDLGGKLLQDRLVFEDAEAGIDAALAAGMYAVGLGPANRVGKAHLVLPSLDGAQVDVVIKALSTTD